MIPKFDNLSIVIQGPLHKNSVDAIPHYQTFGKVVVSHHPDDDLKLLENMDCSSIVRVETVRPDTPYIFNNQNIYWQIITAHAGLFHVETEYTIKLRSDEYFGDLSPMIEKMYYYPSKVITGNMHFRPDRLAKFHICDRIFGGKTDTLRNGFVVAKRRCEEHQLMLIAGLYEYYDTFPLEEYNFGRWSGGAPVSTSNGEAPLVGTARQLHNNHVGVYAETLIGTSLLIGQGIRPSRGKSKQQVKEFFDMVRVEDMAPYRNKFGDSNVPHNWEEIHKIEDL
jgi:hypothetical protein